MTIYDVTSTHEVNSSVFNEVHYDENTATLYLRFKNGRIAAYEGVSSSTAEAFVKYSSLGQFYNWYIQPRYKGVSVDQDAEFVLPESKNEEAKDAQASSDDLKKFLVRFRYETCDEVEVEATDFEAAIAQVKARIMGAKVEKVTYEVE
jgi:hypothetical protein